MSMVLFAHDAIPAPPAKTHASGGRSGEIRRRPRREDDSSDDDGENDLEELYQADEARRKADEERLVVVSRLRVCGNQLEHAASMH
jgi:hypothetical protein